MAAAGGIVYASDVSDIEPLVVAEVSIVASTSSIGTTETVALTLPSATYKADTLYEVEIRGGFDTGSASTYPSFWLRKTDASGSIITNFGPRIPPPGTVDASRLHLDEYFGVGGSDVTAVLVLTASVNSGTFVIVANTQHPARMIVWRRGAASLLSNLPTLS